MRAERSLEIQGAPDATGSRSHWKTWATMSAPASCSGWSVAMRRQDHHDADRALRPHARQGRGSMGWRAVRLHDAPAHRVHARGMWAVSQDATGRAAGIPRRAPRHGRLGGSSLSPALAILPPFAPILMSVGMASGDAAPWQVVLVMSTTVVGIVGLTWLAGRVYANAALRLGTHDFPGRLSWEARYLAS
jgi:hypothetical protein